MIEAKFDNPALTADGGDVGEQASSIPRSSTYCAECGSWGEHEVECLCCGYDFRASAHKATRNSF